MKLLLFLALFIPKLLLDFTTPPRPATAIAFFGDSFSAPAGSGGSASTYPNRVATASGISITNYAVGGTSVCTNTYAPTGGVNLIDKYQTEINKGYTGQMVSFMYGTNDVALGIVNTTWKATYKAIIQAFLTAGWPKRKLLIMVQPAYSGLQASRILPRQYSLEIGRELGILVYSPFVDFNNNPGGNDALFGGDNVHPNSTGDSAMYLRYMNFITR